MAWTINPLQTITEIDQDLFLNAYLNPSQPVVIKNYTRNWPAYSKWNYDYFKQAAGDITVPLYDSSKVTGDKKVNEPATYMKFADYLDLIKQEPSDLRIFLFNIFKEIPSLTKDYSMPDFLNGYLDKFPMMFFGGKGSKVFPHFDLDLSHVFLAHFGGRKKCMLFSPECSDRLYKIPFAVHNLEEIDFDNPDFETYPALHGLKGQEVMLEHGDILFIPSGWWHYMYYTDDSFSLSLRALDSSLTRKIHGAYNIFVMRSFDNLCRKLFGGGWIDYKNRLAVKRAMAAIPQERTGRENLRGTPSHLPG